MKEIKNKKVTSGEVVPFKPDEAYNNLEKNSQSKNKTNKGLERHTEYVSGKNSQKISEKPAENEKKSEKTRENHKNSENREKQNGRKYKNAVIGLTIATSILAATTLGFGIGYGITQSQATGYGIQLENIYKKNYYELVDNVNTADMQISKLLASDSNTYRAKMLTEISSTSKEMQSNVAALPLASDSIVQSVRFINQMSGYTQTLEDKIAKGGALTETEIETLNNMHDALTEMKRYLNQMTTKLASGYSILQASSTTNGNLDDFSLQFSQIKSSDADYPTMIYDGPFSDSVVNQKVKGLSGETLSKEDVYKKVDEVFKNISNLKYTGQTNGKFETYNYTLLNSDNQKIYVQATKIGGNVLTVSGNVESSSNNISVEQAEKVALDFAKANGVKDAAVVWKEILNSQGYFNIAPKQNGIVLYPDLVKVKVDLEYGDVIGYDAMTYFTNHTNRTLGNVTVTPETVAKKIKSGFEVKNQQLVLAPLDYNREVLCWEFECEHSGSTYYIYFNANTGEEENILKVVKTDDSSKLM